MKWIFRLIAILLYSLPLHGLLHRLPPSWGDRPPPSDKPPTVPHVGPIPLVTTANNPLYLDSREGDPASLVENVSVIYGDYSEVEVDMTVSSPDTLVLSRFYSSRDTADQASFCGWRFYPQCKLTTREHPKRDKKMEGLDYFVKTLVTIGNSDGSILNYVGWKYDRSVRSLVANKNHLKNTEFKIYLDEDNIGLCNTAKGPVGMWTNWKNNVLDYNPQNDTFELRLCTEGKRYYKKDASGKFYFLTHEILPSGNKLFYQYNPANQLTFITQTNAAETKNLAWIKIQYEATTVHVTASDGQQVDYYFQKDPSGIFLLHSVVRSNRPNLQYQYQVVDNRILLIRKTLPEGRFIQIGYYQDGNYKVQSVTTPTENAKYMTTGFLYGDGNAIVNGPGGNKTVYFYNEQRQLTTIEQHLDGAKYRVYQKTWGSGPDAGNLISTSIKDPMGNTFYYKYYAYDPLGNIVAENEYGNITGADPSPLVINANGLVSNREGYTKNSAYFSGQTTQVFFQKDAKGAGIKYWYKKGTNLLIKKLVLAKGSANSEEETLHSQIKQRFFYTYNDDAALVKVVIDDGNEFAENDLYNVSERTITTILPKQEIPNVGAPASMEQHYASADGKSTLVKKIVNRFDSQGNITTQEVYDADNRHCYTLQKKYLNGLLIFENDAIGNESQYSYDFNYNLTKEVHSTGFSKEYRYDLRNRLVSMIDKSALGEQKQTQITYDNCGYIHKTQDPFGNETTYLNDALGRPLKITYPETTDGYHSFKKPVYTYQYDLFDNATLEIDPEENSLSYFYTVKGAPMEINYLDGTKETFKYETGGNLRNHYCRNGLYEVFQYDDLGRPIKKIDYHRNRDSFKEVSSNYNAFHKIHDKEGDQHCHYFYDQGGHLVRLEKDGEKIEFTYDSLGRAHSVKRWESATDFTLEIKEYDLLGRVIEERLENASHILLRKQFTYNTAGQLAQIIGYPNNQETILFEYAYDGWDRLSQITNAAGNTTKILYDDNYITEWGQKGLKRTLIDPMNVSTEEIFDNDEQLLCTSKRDSSGRLLSAMDFSYDIYGGKNIENAQILVNHEISGESLIAYNYNDKHQLASITYAKGSTDQKTCHFEYDLYGDLVKTYYQNHQNPVAYQYDLFGNLSALTYEEDQAEVKWTIHHDTSNNLKELSCKNLQVTYSYNSKNQRTSETVKDKFGSYKVQCTRNSQGNIRSIQLPDGSFVEYTYEGPFVKNIVRFNANKSPLYTYIVSSRDQMGNILMDILPGNLTRTQEWDAAGRRQGITSDFFQDRITKYSPIDNVKKRQITFNGELSPIEYDYDSLSQLIYEKNLTEHLYLYDSLGNRLKKNASTYKFNALNQLIDTGSSKYTFHLDGTLETKTNVDNKWIYEVNPLNQILSIDNIQEDLKAIFTYDPTGKRFRKRIDINEKKYKIVRFFYLGETEIGSLDELGNIVDLKIPADPNHPESPAIAIEINKKPYTPLYDLQGNVACLVDPTQQKIIESYRYSAFGEEEIRGSNGELLANSILNNPWRYQGKRLDKETGLIYFGHRYYDPKIGRWISPDPAGTIDGPNLYAFARNNPMKYVDHFGFASEANENVPCQCGYCARGEGCHCLLNIDFPSCQCKGILCNHKRTTGTAVGSILTGITHGAIDFFITDTFESLSLGATYTGSIDLDISFHERCEILAIVEESHRKLRTEIDNQIMSILGTHENDATHQALRSKTNNALTIASLFVGGYKVVQNIRGLTKYYHYGKIVVKDFNNACHIMQSRHSWDKLVKLSGNKHEDFRKVIKILENNKIYKKRYRGEPKEYEDTLRYDHIRQINDLNVQAVFNKRKREKFLNDAWVIIE